MGMPEAKLGEKKKSVFWKRRFLGTLVDKTLGYSMKEL